MEASMWGLRPSPGTAGADKERSGWKPPASSLRKLERHLEEDRSRPLIAHPCPRRGWIARAETALFAATLGMLASVWLGALLAQAVLGV